MEMFRTLADAIFRSGEKTRLGDASYPIIFLQNAPPQNGTTTPVLVSVEGRYFQLFESAAGTVPDQIRSMLDVANKTMLPQIADFNGKVVIAERQSTVETIEAVYKQGFTSAASAVRFIQASGTSPSQPKAAAATPDTKGPGGAG